MSKKTLAIYNPYLETKGGGEKVCLAMAEWYSNDYEVTLVSRSKVKLGELGEYFNLDLSKCKHVVLENPSGIALKIVRKLHFPSRICNLVNDYEDFRRLKKMNFDVFINNCYHSSMPSPAKEGIYMCMFPHKLINRSKHSSIKKFYNKTVDFLEKLLFKKTGLGFLDTYQTITVNSSFTKSWVKKRWHLNDNQISILYPICDDMTIKGVKKEKIILNVGRFFANTEDNHYKCQDTLLDTFKDLSALHKDGWELHFAGSVAKDPESLQYLISLFESAQGYPVFFHLNTPFPELKRLYNKAAIYWHATGWGSDSDKYPEKQEHFGISTVEAMSAGAVPIVIDSAGQKETLVHDKDGYRWDDLNALKNLTIATANSQIQLQTFSKSSVSTAKAYSKHAFNKTISKLLG